MTVREAYRESVPMPLTFLTESSEEDIITVGDRHKNVVKNLLWTSAHIYPTSLDLVSVDCWLIQSPRHSFRCNLPDRPQRGNLFWQEEPSQLHNLTVPAGVYKIFFPALPGIIFDSEAIKKEAEEERFEIPTEQALKSAEIVVSGLNKLGANQFEVAVYPAPDGEVTVDVFRGPEGDRSSILFLCESDGRVHCLTHIKGKNHNQVLSLADFPDAFVLQALGKLMEVLGGELYQEDPAGDR